MHVALQQSHDIFQKWGVVTVNHMNDDITEVNGFDHWMLPGSSARKSMGMRLALPSLHQVYTKDALVFN